MRRVLITIAAFLFPLSLIGDDDPTRTLGQLNGRAWQEFRTAAQARAYLAGLFDGLNYYGPPHIEFRTDRPNVGFTPEEIAAGVTTFYNADSARMRLPIAVAVTMFFRHAEGDSDQRIRERVSLLLKDLDSMIARARTPR